MGNEAAAEESWSSRCQSAKDFFMQVKDNHIQMLRDNQVMAKVELPLVGLGWHCNDYLNIPDHNIYILEWNAGSAGTSSIYSETHLLVFSYGDDFLEQKEDWIIHAEMQFATHTEVRVSKHYTILDQEDPIRIILEGTETHPLN